MAVVFIIVSCIIFYVGVRTGWNLRASVARKSMIPGVTELKIRK